MGVIDGDSHLGFTCKKVEPYTRCISIEKKGTTYSMNLLQAAHMITDGQSYKHLKMIPKMHLLHILVFLILDFLLLLVLEIDDRSCSVAVMRRCRVPR